MAVENGLTFEAGEYDMYWIDKTNPDYGYGSLDNKWVVTDPGNYTITLNQAPIQSDWLSQVNLISPAVRFPVH